MPFLKFFVPQPSMQASQCTTTPRAGAIFRQKSGRGFLRFSLSLVLFPPFPFFRLSRFSAFPSFPRFLKNKSLCGGERSGSPCPLDQISVICLKRCPYLRTYLTEIIHAAWSSGTVPSEWKKACTILIYKKEETDNPANFRVQTNNATICSTESFHILSS